MITVIAARSRNRVIGKNGQIPWHIPADLMRFKELTTGNVVIMGRKTYESIGKPLPNRVNIVVSSSFTTFAEDVWTVSSFEKALEVAAGWPKKKIFIIGGEHLYHTALDSGLVEAIELTLINTTVQDGTAFFPFTPPGRWRIVYESDIYIDDYDLEYVFLRYEPCGDTFKTNPLLYLPAARFDNQAGYMEEILNDGICPFCEKWLEWYHTNPVELKTEHWIVTKNDNPYSGTKLDLLLIPRKHVTSFSELPLRMQVDFGVAFNRAVEHFEIEFGALGMRFGDMSRTGGSVAHLHAHIKVGDVDNPDHQPVRFKMSSVPQDNKSPDQFD